ncbi:MAG: alpha/beta hydrolase [Scytonematopsis contorta HA4267-MV1]|jgi:pimeloyl-ACP methyl ester carboxylesterase|nr:alpha/beta hydrolase [Scytonematopsis contorta HA4267-MV1]
MTIPKINPKPVFLTPKLIRPQYPLFVYLPGMDGTGELLRCQTEGLEACFDVRSFAIPRNDLTSWDDLAHNVLSLIQAELEKNPQRSVYLCGESFGGCLAQKVATLAPDLFHRIILINPASSYHLRPWYDWASQFIYIVPSSLFDFGALGLLPFLAALGRIKRDIRQELLRTMRSVPSETVLWRLSLIKEFHIKNENLCNLKQPVLLIGSALDRLLPSVPEVRRLMDILPNAKILVLPDSGHACLLENDINLYDILQENNFLEAELKEISYSEKK